MDIKIREHNAQVVILDLNGDFDIYNTTEMKVIVNKMIEEKKTAIICNLKQVNYIDSSGIGALMVSLSSMRKAGGKFILLHAYDSVKKVLEITKMTTFFRIFDSEEEAVQFALAP